jgi:hypothetical protein
VNALAKQIFVKQPMRWNVLGEAGLGMAVFDKLKAEHEPWLMECFVPPPAFNFMAGGRSIAVFGDAGSGKSALARSLAEQARPSRLIAMWRPAPTAGSPTPWQDSRSQFEEALATIALSLVRRLIEEPSRYEQAPSWVQSTLRWFARRCLPPQESALPMLLGSDLYQQNWAFLQAIARQDTAEIATREAPVTQVVALLVQALQQIGLDGVWIIADGLEAEWITAPGDAERSLRAFLSTVPLLEQRACIFKMMLPTELSELVLESESYKKNYLDVYGLTWNYPMTDEADEELLEAVTLLREMVERRLALAAGSKSFPLDNLCGATGFLRWLFRIGGESPFGWLKTVRPVAAEYFQQSTNLRYPLNAEDWRKIRRRQPVPVRLDSDESIVVGWRKIRGLGDTEHKVLEYLVEQRGRAVSREELYRLLFPAQRLASSPAELRGPVDTALWRLRKAIEPIPGEQHIISTQRNQGIQLRYSTRL